MTEEILTIAAAPPSSQLYDCPARWLCILASRARSSLAVGQVAATHEFRSDSGKLARLQLGMQFHPVHRTIGIRPILLLLLLVAVWAFPISNAAAQSQMSQMSPAQTDSTGDQQSNQVDCQDPTAALSAACAQQDYSAGGNMQSSQGGGQFSGRSANQPFTGSNYRDENALPNQSRYRYPQYVPVPREPLTEFQKFVGETTGQILPIFGARLFRQVPTTFAPIDQIPVPADAVAGPGDLLRIRIWGQVNFSADLRVDRSGEIYIPQVGPIHVAGLQYSDLDAHLQTAIGRVYRNFNVSAELGQIRSIQIYVAGRARRPGTYTVSSLSTLVDAVFASGGPSLDGSLRHIQLKRAGKLVVDFDLYDLLVDGDKSADAKLEPGDVIFVSPVGPQVALLGSVKTPAIYELKLPETIGQVLNQAAGATNIASSAQLQLERMQVSQGRAADQIAFTPEGLTTPLHDGDIVRLTSTLPSYAKTVTVRGNLANPGRYAWHPGMRLEELFPERNALLTRNYWWQRTRLGLPAHEFEHDPALDRLRQPDAPESLPIRPGELAIQRPYGQLPQQRQPGQQSTDSQQGTQQQQQAAPDPYPYDQNTPVDEQAAAAALAYDANDPTGQTQRLEQQSRALPYGQQQAPPTAATARRDVVTENTAKTTVVNDVTLSAPEIDWSYAVIERLDSLTLKTSLIPFDLGRLVMDHDPAQNLAVQPGDVVTIFSQADIHVPVVQQTRLVRLEGEFLHAGVYSALPGETLQELVVRAGGLTPGAYLFGSEFTRASVRAVQQRRLDEYVQNLQLQVERGILATASAASSSAADLASANVASTEGRELVARLHQVRATGRIVLNLRAFSQGADSLPKLDLEDGDTYYVPSVPANVSVIGAVYDQNSFIYHPGQRVRDYERLAGGANRDADKRHPFVVRADGSVLSQNEVGEKKFERIVIQPGDTLVISEKTFGPTKLREFLNFSQLFAQIAFGAAVFSNL